MSTQCEAEVSNGVPYVQACCMWRERTNSSRFCRKSREVRDVLAIVFH